MKVVFGQPSLFPTQPPSDTVATTVSLLPRLPQLAVLSEGISLLRNAFDPAKIFDAINSVVDVAPFRHMNTPGGKKMSVAMTNCGKLGWVSGSNGYMYSSIDPETAQPWPAMPRALLETATRIARQAGYPGFLPDACLINRYLAGAQMGLHQDRDEKDFSQPIVSLSIGLSARFIIGGLDSAAGRNAHTQSVVLKHGDAIVFGAAARLMFHGVRSLKSGHHPLVGNSRINLTFRVAS